MSRPVVWAKRTVLLAVGVALGVATLVFVTLNRDPVALDFYFGEPVAVPLWMLVVACLLLGWLIPRLLGIGGWFRHVRERSRLRKRIAELEREVVELRNIPLDLDTSTAPSHAVTPVTVSQIGPTRPRPRLVEVVTEASPELLESEASADSGDSDPGLRTDG